MLLSSQLPLPSNKGKQPIFEPSTIPELFPLQIPFPSSNPLPSAESQALLDRIWSTHLSGQKNSQMRKNISDLALHLKSLESKIHLLEQNSASSSNYKSEEQFRHQLLDKVDNLLPDDLSARIRAQILSCQLKESFMSKAQYLSWTTGFPKVFLPIDEFNISFIEQGLVQRFILDRNDSTMLCQLPAIVKYTLSCLGITKQYLLVTISSSLGEREETRFFQPYQLWTLTNIEDGDLFCRKLCATLPDYGTYDHPTEWFETSDAASPNYSIACLQSYNAQADQIQRFISLKRHLEFASTYKGVWSDGRRIICIDDDLADQTHVFYDPIRSGHAILEEILEKFIYMTLDVTAATRVQLINAFQNYWSDSWSSD